MLSVGLVGTWIYHLYDKTVYTSKRNEVFVKDSMAVAQGVEDSLQKIYAQTINNLDAKLDSAQNTTGILQGELGNKLAEINRLRAEIAAILKRNNFKKEDLDLARRKSLELQQLVAELQHRNTSIEEEKKQIAGVLEQVNEQVKNLQSSNQQLDKENKVLTEKVSLASTFMASELKLSPVTVKNDKEQETNVAKKTSKLVVSFAVLNNVNEYEDAEVYVVITQPDGQLLTSDAWESSSSIDTRNEGKKRYTRKVKFEYQKGETKRLVFSLNAEDYQKGTYNLQVYHNGYMIGQANKVLN
jgi:DNA repair exonuclease SbcCD ATPase subunit